MKLTFVTLMLPMFNFRINSVKRSCSAVAMGIQYSDFVRLCQPFGGSFLWWKKFFWLWV